MSRTPPKSPPVGPGLRAAPQRTSFFQWVPTDAGQLRATEQLLLQPLLRLGFEQYMCAGLNTISLPAVAPDGDPHSEVATATTATREVPVRLHHVVFVHGMGGGVATWLPNLKALGEQVGEINAARLASAMRASPPQQRAPPRTSATAAAADAGAGAVELIIVHAFDLPGFARSKHEDVTFADAKHAMDYMTACFEEWFEQNTLSSASRWIRFASAAAAIQAARAAARAPPSETGAPAGATAAPPGETASSKPCGWCSCGSKATTTAGDDASAPATGKDAVPNAAGAARATPLYGVDPFATGGDGSIVFRCVSRHTTLCGHSFGAFTAAHFAMGAPHSVQHLVLCDPWGVQPYDAANPAHSTDSLNWKFKLVARFLRSNESLISAPLRLLGPWAPDVVRKFRPDFRDRWAGLVDDAETIYDYIFHANAQEPPTGERAMMKSVVGRAVAVLALQPLLPAGLKGDTALSVVYGAHTWMDDAAGQAMFEARRQLHPASVRAFARLPAAGHQVNTDQPELFNEFIASAIGIDPRLFRAMQREASDVAFA